ncbi:MAG: 4Fe-4S dicluster domain-containing protein, partial [Bacteroidales bacterium]
MGNLFELIQKDVRFEESLKACMNCGVCTAICAAAEFYQYDPRQICDIVQSRDEEALEALLRSDTIWYCGQCMSCKPRCPRGNIPG